ncbi:hypothetical protein GCM10010297_05040 [Streptomyces malachitofuscus]|nr:hypothetical protein GCM10010297_05040 [Streptomyces malachitofuscus]
MEMVVRRHKTLGAWVPVWVQGPCRNRECEKCPDHEADAGAAPPESRRTAAPEPVSARGNTGGEAPTTR